MNTKILKKTAVAAVTLAVFSTFAWAQEKPDCEFPGGAYYAASNTLYLESFNNDSAKVEINNEAQQCVNNKANGQFKLVVVRNTALAANSTIVLPVNFKSTNDCINLYEPVNFSHDDDGNWLVTAKHLKNDGNANKPMLMITDTDRKECQNIKEIEFTASSLQATEHAVTYVWLYNDKSNENDFSLEGTYSFIRWEKGNSELERVYGYAAKEKGKVTAGKFVKAGSNTFIPPLRAYLKYIGQDTKLLNQNANKSALSKATTEASISLPENINVELIEDDNTTSLAKWNTVTGEIKKLDNWYDLKGRKFNSKPTNHQIFIDKVAR